MSADLLRRAARLIRDRAEAATPGPWGYAADDTDWVIWMPDAGHDGAMVEAEPDAAHIAGMHPGVALAMADLWERLAEHIECHDCEAHCEPGGCAPVLAAEDMARAYLGESA